MSGELAIGLVLLYIIGSAAQYPKPQMRWPESIRAGESLSFVCYVNYTSEWDGVFLRMLVEKVTGMDPIDKTPWSDQRDDGLPYSIWNEEKFNPVITTIRGDDYSASITKDDLNTYLTLNITDAQPMDSGWWGCEVDYYSGLITANTSFRNVIVDGPLSYVVVQEECCIYAGDGNDNFTLSQNTVRKTFFHGHRTDLTCQIAITGSTAPIVNMTINSGSDVIEDLTALFTLHDYNYTKITPYGAGLVTYLKAVYYHDDDFRFDVDHHGREFHCIAQLPGWPVEDASFTILVESPPIRAACNQTIVYAFTGSEEVAIVCHVKGNPAPSVSWSGPDNQPITHNEHFAISEQVSGVVTISTLLIKKVTEEDDGNYTMTAGNKYGTDEATAELIVTEFPTSPSHTTESPTSSRFTSELPTSSRFTSESPTSSGFTSESPTPSRFTSESFTSSSHTTGLIPSPNHTSERPTSSAVQHPTIMALMSSILLAFNML